MKLVLDGLAMPSSVRYDELTPSDTDLGQQISTATFILRDPTRAIAKVPERGMDVQWFDDDNVTLLFRGRISNLFLLPSSVEPVGRAWQVDCQDYNVRLFETQTDALDKRGVIDTDRNFLIAILRAALKGIASSPSGATVDDPLITANEPGWTGIQATTFMSGLDWSYMTPSNAINLLRKYVPNVWGVLGPDLIFRYSLLRDQAPFGVSSTPQPPYLYAMEGYEERTYIGAHRNKMRRGGAAASVATYYDEVSIGQLGVLEDPYKNDTTIPATELRRRTYAEGKNARIRKVYSFSVRQRGLKAGQLIDVFNARLGSGTRPAPQVDTFSAVYGRSVPGTLAGERGRFLIQKVTTTLIAPGQQLYKVEAGDNVKDFSSALIAMAAGAGV